MTTFSEADGRKIVSISTAETVVRIDDFVVDPAARSVYALKVKKADDGDTLRWSDITAFGDDAVTVSGADRVGAADERAEALGGKHHRIVGKLVLTTRGDDIGKVKDVGFDPATGEITALHLADGTVEGVRLVGVGSYAVVVTVG